MRQVRHRDDIGKFVEPNAAWFSLVVNKSARTLGRVVNECLILKLREENPSVERWNTEEEKDSEKGQFYFMRHEKKLAVAKKNLFLYA